MFIFFGSKLIYFNKDNFSVQVACLKNKLKLYNNWPNFEN